MLTTIRGLPGSGKSTMARQLVASGQRDCHFEADMFFRIDHQILRHPLSGILPEYPPLVFGNYSFDVTHICAAHEWCQMKTALALSMGKSVVVSNTFAERWEILPYFEIANWLNLPADSVEVIIATGEWGSVNGVPDHVIARIKELFDDSLYGNSVYNEFIK